MYQAMRSNSEKIATRCCKRRQLSSVPIFDDLNTFVQTGDLPDWPPEALAVVRLGPTHDACRRLLSGKTLDTLPELAWRV
jgi:hypothetical protein